MKDCCRVPENLSEPQAPNPEKPELVVRVCKCGARHFVLSVDPLEMNILGTELG